MPTNYSSPSQKRAARRLAKEYAILQQSPMENCAASPLEDNIFEWHVNLTSANPEFEGVPFHFIMKFPSNYPDAGPKVSNKSYIDHPNVFGSYICLDILTMSKETALRTPYRGWTNAYTVSSILIQLQSFLFEVSPNNTNLKKMISKAKHFECRTCGHGKNGVCFPIIGNGQIDDHVFYPSVLQTRYSNGITFDDLQGRWINSGKLTMVVKGQTCTFESRTGKSIKDVTIEFNGDDYMLEGWSLNRQSDFIIWKKGHESTAWTSLFESEFIVRNTNATPQPNDHVLVVHKLSKFDVGDILVVLEKDTDGDLKVHRKGHIKQTGYVGEHEFQKIQIIDPSDLQINDRVKVIAPFQTNDKSKHELKVGDALIIKRRDTNGMAVNTENNSWKKNKWILEENFYKIKLAKAPKLRSGDILRVVRQFDFDNRYHYSTNDFVRMGDRLRVVEDTWTAPVIVQSVLTPWLRPRKLPWSHMNKVVLVEESTAKKCPAKDRSGPTQGDQIRVIESLSAKYQNDVVNLEVNDTFVITNVSTSGDIEVNTTESNWTHGKWIWQADFDKIEFISAPKRMSKSAEETTGLYYLDILPDHLFQALLEFFNWEDLTRISLVAEEIGHSMLKSKRIQMQSYRCFYTLLDAMDTKTILGFGVKCARMNKRSRKTGAKKYCLQQLHVSFDIMSHEAFDKCFVRNNIWKDREVDGFLPLYINLEHGQRAMALNRSLLPTILRDGKGFSSDIILQIYGKAMNTTVVDMMLSVKDVEIGQLQLTDSIKALEGFMALHHTLLAYALQYPEIVDQCTIRVKQFIQDVQARDKEIVPDIGELLIALSLTDFTWAEFVLAWLEESMTRQVRWVLAKYPNLLTKETELSCVRLNQSFAATRTGKRLAMFQRFFIERIASPLELEGNPEKISILFRQYNERCGRPPLGLAEELQCHSRQVLACNDWFAYFDLVGFIAPSAENLWKWIHNAMAISERKKYHAKSNILHFNENHLVQPTDCAHTEAHNCLCSGKIFKILPPSSTELEYTCKKSISNDKLDVAFCVDTTGSMTRWIEAAKTQVSNTMQQIRKSGKKVRFGFVAYKDHYNKDEVTTVNDFTQKEFKCQKIVDSWCTKGNDDTPEALATALGKVGKLTWDSTAQRICIVITDAPPHGIGSRYRDNYPEGHPNGSDVFKYAHKLGLAGVALYMVYTGRDGLTESVYRGMARRTGGAFLRLSNSSADQLSQIILASTKEEDVLDQLAKTVMPLYEQIKATHSIARHEQMVYELHASAVAANITTDSCLKEENLSARYEKQIQDFVQCRSLAHCREMAESNYYSSFPGAFRLRFIVPRKKMSKEKQLITKEQIRKVLRRIGQEDLKKIQKEGCRFGRPEWSEKAAATRWEEFVTTQPEFVRVTLDQFAPWDKLTRTKLAEYEVIPDEILVRANAMKRTDNYKSKKMKKTYLQVQSERPLIIRSGPGKKYDRVGKIAHGTVIMVQEKSGSWIKHHKGWSKWSKGVFTRYTPQNKKLWIESTSVRKPKPAAKPPTLESKPATNPTAQTSSASEPSSISSKNSTPKSFAATVGPPKLLPTSRYSTPSRLASTYTTPATSESGCSTVSDNSYSWCTYTGSNVSYLVQAMIEQQPKKYVTLQRCVVRADINPRSSKLQVIPENTEIQIDCVYKERGRMISPLKGWVWMSSPQAPLVLSLDFHPRGYDNNGDFVNNHHVLRQPSRVITTAPCVIRRTVNCQSDKLCTLPEGISLYVECVYKQRACVRANINGNTIYGWCWLSSPSGDLVELPPVKPTVVLTGPTVNDNDIQTTRNRLGVYGIQIMNITRLDSMTVELEVSSHQDGTIALKQIREVNGKPVKLAWKKSYLAYREQCSSRV